VLCIGVKVGKMDDDDDDDSSTSSFVVAICLNDQQSTPRPTHDHDLRRR